jgi:hypothetical protein
VIILASTPAGTRLPPRIPRRRDLVDAYAAALDTDPERLACQRCHGWLCVRCLGCHCHVVRCTCAPRQCCGGGCPK